MIRWVYYPRSEEPPELALQVVKVFTSHSENIDSSTHARQESNIVLREIAQSMSELGFKVETGKKKEQQVRVPVLYGLNGKPEKSFHADAYHREHAFVVEVEAGSAVANYHFLKDIFQACMMHGVEHLAIAVRNDYRRCDDFEEVRKFLDTLYASRRLTLPLKGLLLMGY